MLKTNYNNNLLSEKVNIMLKSSHFITGGRFRNFISKQAEVILCILNLKWDLNKLRLPYFIVVHHPPLWERLFVSNRFIAHTEPAFPLVVSTSK